MLNNALQKLCYEYGDWVESQKLPCMSADELLYDLCYLPADERNETTKQQIDWLTAFSKRWRIEEVKEEAREANRAHDDKRLQEAILYLELVWDNDKAAQAFYTELEQAAMENENG